MASPTFSLTDILIRGRRTNSQVIVSGIPSRHEKKIEMPDRRLTIKCSLDNKCDMRPSDKRNQYSASDQSVAVAVVVVVVVVVVDLTT